MKSLHIMHTNSRSETVPIPLVLYVSEDLMKDKGTTNEEIAQLLLDDLAFGVKQRRIELKEQSIG